MKIINVFIVVFFCKYVCIIYHSYVTLNAVYIYYGLTSVDWNLIDVHVQYECLMLYSMKYSIINCSFENMQVSNAAELSDYNFWDHFKTILSMMNWEEVHTTNSPNQILSVEMCVAVKHTRPHDTSNIIEKKKK